MSTGEERGLGRSAGASANGDEAESGFQAGIRQRRPGQARGAARTRRGALPGPLRPRCHRGAAAAPIRRAGAPGPTRAARCAWPAGCSGERRHGGLDFADLRDETGTIQLLVARDEVGEQALQDFSDLDLGDWIGVEGTVVASDHGELSVRVTAFELLSKSLRAMPSVRHGLADPEARYRRRYLDLTLSESDPADVRDPFGGDRGDAASADRARLSRGRDAGAAGSGGRRRRAAVHHPPQLARHRHDAADRARAAAQAADRRRHGPGVRDRPRVPQRGARHAAQPRVHAAGGLPGVRRLPRHDGPDRGDRRRGRSTRRSAPPWSRSATARSISSRPGAG